MNGTAISGKEENLARYTEIMENIPTEISVPFDFVSEFPFFAVECFKFLKFNNFRICRKLF